MSSCWPTPQHREEFINLMVKLPWEKWEPLLEDPFSKLWNIVFDHGDETLVIEIGKLRAGKNVRF